MPRKTKKNKSEISEKLREAAREAGFLDVQIDNFTDPKLLEAEVIRIRPELALKLREVPEAPKRAEKIFVDAKHKFEFALLAGFGPMSSRAAKEQREIDMEIRRKNIHDIDRVFIERRCRPEKTGRVISIVTVEYKKEK